MKRVTGDTFQIRVPLPYGTGNLVSPMLRGRIDAAKTATEASLEHTAGADQLRARRKLAQLFRTSPLAEDDLLFNLGLWARSGLLVKFLVMADLYKRFMHIPGILCEFGVWYGQNLVLLENLRAIYEWSNKQRRIIGFDTFEGYKDGKFAGTGMYSTGLNYQAYLTELLKAHQRANVYGHIPGDHELVAGDVTKTAPAYFKRHPEAIVAFAYFDMGPEKPTLAAMKAIKPHLVSGSVILLDELTWHETPGEAIALKKLFRRSEYRLEKCALYPSKAIVTIQ